MPLVQKDYYLSSEALELIEKALPDEYSEHNLLEALRNGLKAWVLDEKSKKRILIPPEIWQQCGRKETPGSYEPNVRFVFSSDLALLTVSDEGFLPLTTSYSGELQIDKEGLDLLLAQANAGKKKSETTAPPRNQDERKKARTHRDKALQEAANKVWKEGREQGDRLTKEQVAEKLLNDPNLKDVTREKRARDEGPLTKESLVRIINMPEWLPRQR